MAANLLPLSQRIVSQPTDYREVKNNPEAEVDSRIESIARFSRLDDQPRNSRNIQADRFLVQLKIQNSSLVRLNQKVSKTRKAFTAEIDKDSLQSYLGKCWMQLGESFKEQYQKIRQS